MQSNKGLNHLMYLEIMLPSMDIYKIDENLDINLSVEGALSLTHGYSDNDLETITLERSF